MKLDITHTQVKYGYIELSTIYKNIVYRHLYDTYNKRRNEKHFKEYVLESSHKLGYYQP